MTTNTKIWIRKVKAATIPSWSLFGSIICLVLGILINIWPLRELALEERLRMRPGLPPFNWWVTPPTNGYLDIYIYNITNADRFLNGDDPKLLLQEIGPIQFEEVWRHQDVVFNDNDTMSYMANRTIVYSETNTIDLNATIVFPNMAVLLALSYLWDTSFMMKLSLSYLLKTLNSKPIINTTIYNILYENTDPFLDVAHQFAPHFAPIKNMGLIYLLYRESHDQVTAFVGTKSGNERFSLIDKYSGSSNIPNYGDSCKMKITNATEALICNQMIRKDEIIRYFRKSLCRVVLLYFEEEDTRFDLTLYKFAMKKDGYKRISPLEDDCHDSYPSLPDGISDVSKCYFSFPLVVSFVYFNYTDVGNKSCAEILRPNGESIELPHLYVEPVTGMPLISSAPVQAHLNIRPLKGFNKMFDQFSDKILPIYWLHYQNKNPAFKVLMLIRIFLFLPVLGWILTVLLFTVGLYCMWKSVRRKPELKDSIAETQQVAPVELEAFIKK